MSNDYNSLITPRGILAISLMVLIAIGFGIAVLRIFYLTSKWIAGWKALTRRFPATDVHKFGDKYKGQTGVFGHKFANSPTVIRSQFLIELAQEGLLVTPNFAKRSPILIPWTDICDVSGTTLTVNYENQLKFTTPEEALTAIQESVPAERLHKAESLSQLIKTRFNHDA